jgi:formate-dependent nitrite reductase membrane component NrfD
MQSESGSSRPATITASTGVQDTYYGIPPIKAPHWHWLIINYFFLAALAGGSFTIATLADLFSKDRALVRLGRYLSLATVLPAPVLLVLDLGRPERALNMFRIVKLKSPMSLGAWALLFLGLISGLVASLQFLADITHREIFAGPRRILGIIGLPFSLFISGYTGVLLAATNVPLWGRNYLLLGPTFLASAFSSSIATLSLLLRLGGEERESTIRSLRRAEIISLAAELSLLGASIRRLGKLSRPLTTGTWGVLFWPVTVVSGILVPLMWQLLSLVRGNNRGQIGHMAASLLVLMGSYCLRMLMIFAGRKSASQPEDYFDYTRRPE